MITDQLASYTQQLLDFNATLIVIGRQNASKVDSETNYIVIDELFSIPSSGSKSFDGDAEVMTYTTKYKGNYTIDFHGEDARVNAVKFLNLQRSQASYELQKTLELTVYLVTNVRDLKLLEGSQYKPRYQVELKLQYNESEMVNTLRIDTAETTLITN